MNTQLFAQFAPVIRSLSAAELADGHAMSRKLLLTQKDDLDICYAPFEYVNPQARVVIVGITPGRQQMRNAVQEARRQLDRGANHLQALRAAKQVGAFSGDMRTHLVNLLNEIGIHRWLGIPGCEALFGQASDLVQTASVLRFPVFYKGKDYNGTPKMTTHPLLQDQLSTVQAQSDQAMPSNGDIKDVGHRRPSPTQSPDTAPGLLPCPSARAYC